MPIEDIPLIDHHCHGVSPADVDWIEFQKLFSESYRPPPPGTTEFQKPLGPPSAPSARPSSISSSAGEAYVERRLALGAAEVNRRMMRAAKLDCLIVDTGHRSPAIHGFAETGALAGRPAHEVVRIEAIIEESRRAASRRKISRRRSRPAPRRTEAVGLKSIVAYRCNSPSRKRRRRQRCRDGRRAPR